MRRDKRNASKITERDIYGIKQVEKFVETKITMKIIEI